MNPLPLTGRRRKGPRLGGEGRRCEQFAMKRRNNFLIARSLRKCQTSGERIVWNLLRKDQTGFHFRRQHPIGGFVLDFYCASARVAVEVDGPFHEVSSDRARDDALKTLGIVTLRVTIDELDAQSGIGAELFLRRVAEVCSSRTALVGGSCN